MNTRKREVSPVFLVDVEGTKKPLFLWMPLVLPEPEMVREDATIRQFAFPVRVADDNALHDPVFPR